MRLSDYEILHVYAPVTWHDEAGIVGTRDALVALRAAIDDALANRRSTFETFVANGEGYDLHVVCVEPEDLDRIEYPYTHPFAQSHLAPWTELLAVPPSVNHAQT